MSSSTEEDKKKMLITSKNEKNINMLSVSRKKLLACMCGCVSLPACVCIWGKKMRIIEENMDFEGREHEKDGILITN